jgi:outer membrane protein
MVTSCPRNGSLCQLGVENTWSKRISFRQVRAGKGLVPIGSGTILDPTNLNVKNYKKTIMKSRILLLAILVSAVSYIHAENQPLKIAYVKLDYVMRNLPDTKQAETDLKAYAMQLDTQLQSKAAVLQEEYEALSKGGATMAEEARKKKETNFNRLRVDFENLQREYQNLLENKQIELVTPIREKIQQKIEEIAKEQKYDYVLNTSVGTELDIVLYGKPELDISKLVLTKLGVDLKATAQAKQAATKAGKQDNKAKEKGKAKK